MTTQKIPTDEEVKRQLRIKSVELAIKATVGKNASQITTVMKAAQEIFNFLIQK